MGKEFTIKLADLIIGVSTIHDFTYALCADYLYGGDGEPDVSVTTDQASIDHEREVDELGDFDDAYYESLAVYRGIAEVLPRFGRILVHGSAVAIGERAWLFMAPSGTGKSTHTRWWRSEFADQEPYMVNDDKPIIRVSEDGVSIYGTPWDGKDRLSTNTSARLAGIGLLERGDVDTAVPAVDGSSVTELMRHSYRPTTADAMRATLGALIKITASVPIYRVAVTNSAHAAHVTHAAMA